MDSLNKNEGPRVKIVFIGTD